MFVREIRPGDTILLRENVSIVARGTLRGELGPEQRPIMYVFDTTGKQWSLHPGDIVQLVHRPDPNRDEAALIDRIEKCAEEFLLKRNVSRQDEERTLAALSKAIEAYELGKSPVAQEAVPSEDSCKMGTCAHPKNMVGMCLVYIANDPAYRDC